MSKTQLRSHTCGELSDSDKGSEVTLSGWVNTRRDHGGIIFIDLRDRYGYTQIVIDPKICKEFSLGEGLRREDVISITGKVELRKEGMENPKLATGKIEVFVSSLAILSKADTPPIEIDDRIEVGEDISLKYRYLLLRREKLQQHIALRHRVTQTVRKYFDDHKFIEIETPMLAKSTPEGARDYLVPSRVHQGEFYALPQSPQIFKQLLMLSGFDRYVQIVKCFRDEDLRADRQPEFTQIDLEMSFVEEEDVYTIMEGMIKAVWKETKGVDLDVPFTRLTYAEAIEKYGSDKPDLRFDLPMHNVSSIVEKSDFSVFSDVVKKGGKVKALCVPKGASLSRKEIDELISVSQIYGAKGLAWIKVTPDGLESAIVKYLNDDIQKQLVETLGAKEGDLLCFVGDPKKGVADTALGQVRLHLGKKLNLIDEKQWNFLWVVDFPLVEYDEDEGRFNALHHPFTAPKDEHVDLMTSEPGKVLSKAYDLVLNGVELGGGSIRIHNKDTQSKMFDALGISKEEAQEKFGFLLEAFRYGAPPHGGIAFGLDRMVALLCGTTDIREVIAFPKNKAAASLMDDSPSTVSDVQLKELGLKVESKKVDAKKE